MYFSAEHIPVWRLLVNSHSLCWYNCQKEKQYCALRFYYSLLRIHSCALNMEPANFSKTVVHTHHTM